jgi:hypothetical protein
MQSVLRKVAASVHQPDTLPGLLLEYKATLASTPPIIIDQGWIAFRADGLLLLDSIPHHLDFTRLVRVARSSSSISLIFPHVHININPKSLIALARFDTWFQAAEKIMGEEVVEEGIDGAWTDIMQKLTRSLDSGPKYISEIVSDVLTYA